ncbi:MAG: hypothetical protein RLY86_3589 [Pseudomonadota bacterium]|jgi:hypothetical protein
MRTKPKAAQPPAQPQIQAGLPRDPLLGEMRPVGYGSLRGRLVIPPDLDLTRPIQEQVTRLRSVDGTVGMGNDRAQAGEA